MTTMMTRLETRAELEEAMRDESSKAGRMLRYDSLGRPNEAWARCHQRLNVLLTTWQATTTTDRLPRTDVAAASGPAGE